MDTHEQTLRHSMPHEEDKTLIELISGSVAAGVAGIGAAVLAILGLTGIFPLTLVCVATIAVGVALVFRGFSVAAKFSTLLRETESPTKTQKAELGGGMTAESLGGIAGVALGILALLNVSPMILVSAATIVFGAAVLLGSGVDFRLNTIESAMDGSTSRILAHEAVALSADLEMMVGIGAITLGILALVGLTPMTLTLVAMLGLGAVDFLSSTTTGGRLIGVLRHHRAE